MRMRILSAACAVMLTLGCLTGAAASADEATDHEVISGEQWGDPDGRYDADDAEDLGYWLTCRSEAIGKIMDLNHNDTIDAVDMTLLKRLLLEMHTSYSSADISGKELPEPPVRALDASMPSVGTVRIPVFAVSFPDCRFEEWEFDMYCDEFCFGARDACGHAYPMESISAYFERASYGRFHLTGDTVLYEAEYPIGHYADNYGSELVEEVLAAYDAQTDYTVYDADSDQMLDAVMIVLPYEAQKIDSDGDKIPDWWPFSVSDNCDIQVDGLSVGTYCFGLWSLSVSEFAGKMVHELGHAMGLTDYYIYGTDGRSDAEGMTGDAGCELMDEGDGDLSAFSKLLLGWLAEDEVQIYTGGTQRFTLTSMQQRPSCVIVPRDPDAGFLSEFFLIEYITGEANNTVHFRFGRPSPIFEKRGGVRILHCQAEVKDGYFGPEFRYGDLSSDFDKSGEKQRVLRLVSGYDLISGCSSGNKFFTDQIPEFHWYDADGSLNEPTGLKVAVYGPDPGPAFDPDAVSVYGLQIYDEQAYLNGSTFEIVISPDDTAGMPPADIP